jgi:hypothetical protein
MLAFLYPTLVAQPAQSPNPDDERIIFGPLRALKGAARKVARWRWS